MESVETEREIPVTAQKRLRVNWKTRIGAIRHVSVLNCSFFHEFQECWKLFLFLLFLLFFFDGKAWQESRKEISFSLSGLGLLFVQIEIEIHHIPRDSLSCALLTIANDGKWSRFYLASESVMQHPSIWGWVSSRLIENAAELSTLDLIMLSRCRLLLATLHDTQSRDHIRTHNVCSRCHSRERSRDISGRVGRTPYTMGRGRARKMLPN